MKICDLTSCSVRIQRNGKVLRDAWLATKEHWTDGSAQKFEKERLTPLAMVISQTLASVHEMDKILRDAQRECEEDRLA